ncbi:MAG: hypothetical protein ACHQ49_13395 [Elusimicrobiota bacterium]
MATQDRKSVIEQIARRHVASIAAMPYVHSECVKSSRCLAVDAAAEPGEDGWDRFYGDLKAELKIEGEMDDETVDEVSGLYSAAFAAEWRAQVKACK